MEQRSSTGSLHAHLQVVELSELQVQPACDECSSQPFSETCVGHRTADGETADGQGRAACAEESAGSVEE